MPKSPDSLYLVWKNDISKAGITLADAFQEDDIWEMFFKDDATLSKKGTLFQAPVRYCYKYGKVFATSVNFEGVAAWVPGYLADMTIWRLIQSGAIFPGIKALSACTKLAQKQGQIFKPLEEDRKVNMKGKSFIYLMVIGVASEFQGQGYGKMLLDALIRESEKARVPIYTETQTENNVRFYEKQGFRQIKKITLPVINRPQWELIREPKV